MSNYHSNVGELVTSMPRTTSIGSERFSGLFHRLHGIDSDVENPDERLFVAPKNHDYRSRNAGILLSHAYVLHMDEQKNPDEYEYEGTTLLSAPSDREVLDRLSDVEFGAQDLEQFVMELYDQGSLAKDEIDKKSFAYGVYDYFERYGNVTES